MLQLSDESEADLKVPIGQETSRDISGTRWWIFMKFEWPVAHA